MTKPKKALHADLNGLIDFYEKQHDFVGGGCKPLLVNLSPRELDTFAKRPDKHASAWTYRGFTLVRALGAKQ